MIVLLLLSSAFIGTLTNGFRFYQNNEANLECPISTAKPNLDVDRVSTRGNIWEILLLNLPSLLVHGPLVHPGVSVSPRDEDGRPELPDVQVLSGRGGVLHHGQLHLQIPPSVNIRAGCCVMNIHKVFSSHGHFYTIPTKSEIVADGQDGLWLTEFKGGI